MKQDTLKRAAALYNQIEELIKQKTIWEHSYDFADQAIHLKCRHKNGEPQWNQYALLSTVSFESIRQNAINVLNDAITDLEDQFELL